MKQKASQGFPDILEIERKSSTGEERCDDLKFSEIIAGVKRNLLSAAYRHVFYPVKHSTQRNFLIL